MMVQLTVPAVDGSSRCIDVVRAAFAVDVGILRKRITAIDHDPPPDTIHQCRVAIRRVRSNLRTFAPILDDHGRRELSDRLRPLADSLGSVRDVDVLAAMVRKAGAKLGESDATGVAELSTLLADRRARATASLSEQLSLDTTTDAIEATTTFARAPPVSARADERGAVVLAELARPPWRRLVRRAAPLDETSSIEQLHDMRILVKRARYAADAAGLVRPPAIRHAAALAALQQVLGDINDASLAEQSLRAMMHEAYHPEPAVVAGLMIGALRRAERRARRRWPAAWDQARRKAVRRWLESST